jgi:Mrp family chromosome partitioning ATPase
LTGDSHVSPPGRQLDLGDYLRVLRRRKWHVLGTALLITLLTLGFSLSESKVYSASSAVLLDRADIAAAVTGTAQNPTLSEDPARYAQTQASVARSPAVALIAIQKSKVRGRDPGQLLAESSVTPNANADVLVFKVDDANAAVAAQLVNAYASAFASYKLGLDTTALQRARQQLSQQITTLRNNKQQATPQYRNLVNSEQQLHTMQLLQSQDTVLGHPSAGAQVKPTPLRDGLLGLGFGLLIGIGLAFAVEALDRRVRSEEEIEDVLRLPLLARVPKPPAAARERPLTMVDEPRSGHAEAIRRLATSISFVSTERSAQVFMITSSVQREGKSTTVANLGIALARAGHSVALVDLDLRQPALASFFGIRRLNGVTDVARGLATLDSVLTPIELPADDRNSPPLAGEPSLRGSLSVLPSGPLPVGPGEFVASDAVASRVLAPLRDRFDLVLIDTPPISVVGDAAALSPRVEAVLVVARLGVINRPALRDVKRQLAACAAPAIGVVINGADVPTAYGYSGYYDGAAATPAPSTNGAKTTVAGGANAAVTPRRRART